MTYNNQNFSFWERGLKISVSVRDEKIWDIDLALMEGGGDVPAPYRRIADNIRQVMSGDFFTLDDHWIALSRLTPFQRQIFEPLVRLPAGRTITYGELADLSGCPGAARAVGQALGANPFPILIPCHRVIPKSGGIGEFSGGPEIKRWLLDSEKMG